MASICWGRNAPDEELLGCRKRSFHVGLPDRASLVNVPGLRRPARCPHTSGHKHKPERNRLCRAGSPAVANLLPGVLSRGQSLRGHQGPTCKGQTSRSCPGHSPTWLFSPVVCQSAEAGTPQRVQAQIRIRRHDTARAARDGDVAVQRGNTRASCIGANEGEAAHCPRGLGQHKFWK